MAPFSSTNAMDTYDSDSSSFDDADGDFTETGVLLGYPSKEPTDDSISHLGGWPAWLDPTAPPPGNFAKCRVCQDPMPLLLQLNGDLPEHFPDDERRLYIFGCVRRTCSRKQGTIRALRGVRKHKTSALSRQTSKAERERGDLSENAQLERHLQKQDLGASLFGVSPSSNPQVMSANPFSTSNSTASEVNPFAPLAPPSTLAAKVPQKLSPLQKESLPESFADKVRITSTHTSKPPVFAGPLVPWPAQSSFPTPYPHYYFDAEYETLSRSSTPKLPASVQTQTGTFREDDPTSLSADPKDTFESTLDKSFHRFSIRLAHNPEQVLRYEFRGNPLLYSTSDAVGKLFHGTSSKLKFSSGDSGPVTYSNRIPRCESCGRERVFELQLVPHAISVLEEGREGIGFGSKDDAGMEWGTVILGVCASDCGPEREGEAGWREEWVGVQWEERAMGMRQP